MPSFQSVARRRVTIVRALIGLSLAACGGGADSPTKPSTPTTPTPETVASVAVTPSTLTLQAGTSATGQLAATVTGSRGSTMTGQTVQWTSSDITRATVSGAGLVTPVAAGQTTITATVDGKTGTALVTVTPPPGPTVSITPGNSSVALGLSVQLTGTVRDAAGTAQSGQTIAWSSSDTTIANIDANGLLVTSRAGSANIIATSGSIRGETSITVAPAPSIASCKLPNRTSAVGFGFPRATQRLRSTGTVRATVIFVDFSDNPGTRTPQSLLDIVQPAGPTFYSTLSYGAMSLVMNANLKWFRMSKASTEYGWPNNVTFAAHKALLQEAADLAASTTDFSQTDLLVVMTPPDAGAISFGPALVANAGTGISVPGRSTTIDNATNSSRDLLVWQGGWLTHETGHTMSLPDLYETGTNAGTHRHVGEWSAMGLINGRAPEWTAMERWQLGWLADEQIVCAPSGTSLVTLTPIETAGGRKATMLPLSATTAVVIESRRAIGYDNRLTQPGPLVYFIDTNVQSGKGTMRVLPEDDSDVSKMTRTLTVGQTLTYQGASVTLVSRTEGTDVVRVTRP